MIDEVCLKLCLDYVKLCTGGYIHPKQIICTHLSSLTEFSNNTLSSLKQNEVLTGHSHGSSSRSSLAHQTGSEGSTPKIEVGPRLKPASASGPKFERCQGCCPCPLHSILSGSLMSRLTLKKPQQLFMKGWGDLHEGSENFLNSCGHLCQGSHPLPAGSCSFPE